MNTVGPKIFQIGHNKCGTSSLSAFMKLQGLPTANWLKGELAEKITERIQSDEDPVMDYPTCIGFTDMMTVSTKQILEPYRDLTPFYKFHPNAYYILNTRNASKWLTSRINHNGGALMRRYRAFYKMSEKEVIEHWRREWYAHHSYVLDFFSNKSGRLLVFDIEADDPAKLCEFLSDDYKVKPEFFQKRHATKQSVKA